MQVNMKTKCGMTEETLVSYLKTWRRPNVSIVRTQPDRNTAPTARTHTLNARKANFLLFINDEVCNSAVIIWKSLYFSETTREIDRLTRTHISFLSTE